MLKQQNATEFVTNVGESGIWLVIVQQLEGRLSRQILYRSMLGILGGAEEFVVYVVALSTTETRVHIGLGNKSK